MKKSISARVSCLLILIFLWGCNKEDEVIFPGSGSINAENQASETLKSAYTIINFSGYDWYVKDGTGLGPGPNNWSANNVWVDELGKLHLKISYNEVTQKWECADIYTTQNLGFGKYEWWIDSRLDQMDKNVVLGLFNYPTGLNSPDGSNEIDIEFSRWGVENANVGNYVVYPARLLSGYSKWSNSFPVSLSGSYTTQRFTWSSSAVNFQSLHGWQSDNTNLFYSKSFTPSRKKAKTYIPQQALPIHINLWLFRGMAPSNNQPVEVIIGKFTKS